jgi:hypothetical protein
MRVHIRNSKFPKRGNLSLNSELNNLGGQVETHFPKNRDLIHE